MMVILNQDLRIVLAKIFNLLGITLILSGLLVNTQAKRMDEAVCKPRPVTVAVTKNHDVLPYHVLLHRCSGTCDYTSPLAKSCEVNIAVEIDLEVTDANNQKRTIKVANHTSCYCKCKCRSNEILTNQKPCTCIPCTDQNCDIQVGHPNPSGQRKGDEQKIPMPYLIGMVVVGIFTIIVLLYDATLYFKKSGFFHDAIKHTCCQSMNNNQEISKSTCNERSKDKETMV